jgi:membrane protein implicated in regulation of membrane protease activity
MIEYMIWIWLALFVVAAIFEFVTLDLVSIWFAIASIPSFIMSLLNVNVAVQVITFIVVSFGLLLFTRPVALKYFKTNEIRTNVDSIIGMTGTVISRITPSTIGRVKIRGIEWSAISKNTLEIEEQVRVLDVEGVKLIVESIS